VVTRRQAIRIGALAGLGLTFGRRLFSTEVAPRTSSLVTRPIPSTGERLPVVGLGTNRYGVTAPEERALLKEVLRRMAELGGTVIDTAPAYGRSEQVLGDLLAVHGGRQVSLQHPHLRRLLVHQVLPTALLELLDALPPLLHLPGDEHQHLRVF